MNLLADIATGNTGTADVLFLIAVILAVISALIAWRPAPESRWSGPLLSLAVAAAAFAWLLL
jgi:phosphoglycerol transferase MdoB-like AlkP superfamily enzyme